ncbi:Disease resistance protein [Melia azedarach]|uniref:Disease resistance protein n=2 Tax=Melia azedarach TaxID=155640 RepID=A0ACC1XJQ4_MELAZ|nr:Disease resistance protein [Melia azedarach]KAJ4711543.1 Disease resistance protein [Melia azedarach]
MAEAVLSALIQVIFQNSTSQIFEEFATLFGARKEMQKLRSVLSTIQAVLEDAEDRQVTDKAVKNWLIKLKDAAHDVDDLLDEYMTETLKHKSKIRGDMELRGCMMNDVRYFCSQSNPILSCYRMKKRLEKIVEKLNEITAERFKYHLRDISILSSPCKFYERLQSDSYLQESEVFGRDVDREKIVKFLTDSADQGDVSVLPIVGMGGLGKTTLAKLVYNDERVQKHFERRIWVSVSEVFDVKRLMRAIVESVTGNRCDLEEVDTIHRRIQELIMGQRFLVALDDVWNDDHEKWDRLKNSLRHGSEGSKILVTTRSEKVALIMGSVPSYCLEGLSDDDCWSLFEQRAFKYRKPDEKSNLLAIGKEIAEKCKGVPLAAKALGSLMCLKRNRSDWLSVKGSEIWNIVKEENGILPVLRLSYDNLPSHLKQCFAYCSLFPKDWTINKEKLIQLWMAEGFVQSSEGQALEEVGNEYFNELLWRSFFHNATKDSNGSIVACEMHNLLHDLAQSVATTSCLTMEVGKQCVPTGTRHLSVVCTETKILGGSRNASKLRSFILLHGKIKIIKVSSSLILSFKSLRSLNLSSTRIKKLSKSIGALRHLRYVDLSNTLIRRLPNSTCSLFNLQSLILTHCNRLETLPLGIGKLINLRHLDLYGCELLTELPKGIGELSLLRTLPVFLVGKENDCSIAELENLDLHGELKIKNLENVLNARNAKNANLKEKRDLLSLKLIWGHTAEVNVRENVEHVAESLQPNSGIKMLFIENYAGSKFPSWLMNPSVTNLVELSLIRCRRCAELPPMMKLPFLEVLTIDEIDGTMYFCNESEESGGVAKTLLLKKMVIKNMPNLLGWSVMERKSILPCLEELVIEACPNLIKLPDLPSIKSLNLDDCRFDLLRMVTKITSLSSLFISRISGLTHLPEGLLRNNQNLLSLGIRDCPRLVHFSGELENLSALQSLYISSCPELMALSGLENLISLKSLKIDDFHPLSSLPEHGLRGLDSLQYVSLSNCENLASLPEAMQHLTGLKLLHIWSCPQMETLPEWLGNLASLQELELWYCENLICLPESMHRLTALQFLSIWSCPHLNILCEEERGADWHKIQHIPFIKINGPYIQALSI